MASSSTASSNSTNTNSTNNNETTTTTTATTTTTSEDRQPIKAPFFQSLSDHQLSTMSLERVKELRIEEGIHGLIDLRAWGAARAANIGRLDLVTYFIEERGVRVSSFTEEEEELLAEEYDGSNKEDLSWGLPLQGALMTRQEEIVDYLMARMQKEEVDTHGYRGGTSLIVAARASNLNAVKRLVESFGADTEAVCCKGCTALCHGVKKGHTEVVDFFLEYARSKGGEEGLQTLIKNCCNCLSNSSLMYRAIFCDSLPMIECIVGKAGKESTLYSIMSTWEEDSTGEDAIYYPTHLAACKEKLPILKWLLSQDVPVDLVTPTTNYTALHYNCSVKNRDEGKRLEVVRYLVEDMHANIHIKNSDGVTAEDIAPAFNYHRIAAYLKGRRALEVRRAQRAKKTGKAATAPQSEEEVRQAAVAADEAAARLLQELEAEEQASATSAESSSTTKRKKKKSKKKGRAQGDGSGGGSSSMSSAPEVVENETSDLPADVSVAALQGLSIAETIFTTTTAPDEEDDEEAFQSFLLETAPDTLICPISHTLFLEPIIAQDERTYEKANLEEWIASCTRKGNPLTSPITGAVMAPGFVRS
jgi:ankyrin repeat protein